MAIFQWVVFGFMAVSGFAYGGDYAPGLGEVMSRVQQHHAKLYFAGKAENWDLASYELDEIKEGLDDAGHAHKEFKTLKTPLRELIPAMTKTELEKISDAIKRKS